MEALRARSDDRDELLEQFQATAYPLMRQLQSDVRQALAPLGLQPPIAMMLLLVGEEGIHHPKELADLLDVPPSMVSVMLNTLQRRGFLVRDTDPEDRRRVLLSVTDDGLSMLQRVKTAWMVLTRDRLAVLDDRLLGDLVRIQRILVGGPS